MKKGQLMAKGLVAIIASLAVRYGVGFRLEGVITNPMPHLPALGRLLIGFLASVTVLLVGISSLFVGATIDAKLGGKDLK